MRRNRELKSAAQVADFQSQNLHRLFRLFDVKNDHSLTFHEFQTGLKAMGTSLGIVHA